MLNRLKLGYAQRHSTSPAAAEKALRAELADDRAVYCLVDRGALPWHSGEMSVSADPYGVAVAGSRDGAFLLDDRDPAPHRLAEEEFMAAWSGHRKGRHHRVTIDRAGEIDLPDATRAALGTTVAHLTGPVLGNSFDTNFGFSGMRRLAGQLRDTRTKTGWARRFADPVASAWAPAGR